MAVEFWFLRSMLWTSWTERKNNDEVLEEVQRTLMKRIRQRQLALLGHDLRRQGLENLVMTGRIEGRRARGRQRLDSLCASWKDNVSPTELIRASEDRVLWHRMVANVVNDGTAP